MNAQLKAPSGQTRVVGVDLFAKEDYLVGDFDSKDKAIKKADAHNKKRLGPMDDVYYVYNDRGQYIHGNEAGRSGSVAVMIQELPKTVWYHPSVFSFFLEIKSFFWYRTPYE
ncbi:MAG: hypothetical protein HYV45_01090 [Candidatus Moranbacteria bacterium]|nr:hypothetical protein [Candidatus Moranbacteria bacterium]